MATSSKNSQAAVLIRELRREKGLTPEALSYAVFKAGFGQVSPRTIRRVESTGMIPRIRVQFALAQFFERSVTEMWPEPMRAAA